MSVRFDSKREGRASSKKKSKANRRKNAEDSDDTDSVGSGGAAGDEKQTESVEMTFEDSFRADIDSLSQRRAATRVLAYKKINEKVAQNMLGSWLESFEETLKLHIYSSLKKGDGEEIQLACRLLMLTAISMAERSDEILRSSKTHLAPIIRNRSRSHVIRTAAMEAFGFLASFNLENFYGSSDNAARQEDLDVLSGFFEKDAKALMLEEKRLEGEHYSSARHGSDAEEYSSNTDASEAAAVKPQASASSLPVVVGPVATPPLILSQALSSWCLVASTFSSFYVTQKLLAKYLPLFRAFLHHDAVDVRETAGECIALLFSAYQSENEDESDEEEESVSATHSQTAEHHNDNESDNKEHSVELTDEAKKQHVEIARAAAGDEESKPTTVSLAESSAHPSAPNGVNGGVENGVEPATEELKSGMGNMSSNGSSSTNGHMNGKGKSKHKSGVGAKRTPRKAKRQLSVSSIRYDPKNQEARLELVSLLTALTHESDRSESRRARARQRAAFRDIVATVESAEVPIELMQIGKWKYEFVGWNQLLQLNALRAVFGSGLLLHFKRNPFFGAIFDMDIDVDDDTTSDLDRQQKKAISKAREKVTFQEINKLRKKKNAFVREQFQDDE